MATEKLGCADARSQTMAAEMRARHWASACGRPPPFFLASSATVLRNMCAVSVTVLTLNFSFLAVVAEMSETGESVVERRLQHKDPPLEIIAHKVADGAHPDQSPGSVERGSSCYCYRCSNLKIYGMRIFNSARV